MSFDPVKKSAIAEEIASRILSLIRERELRAGERLPPERELAAMLGVSRPSLREALRALSIMNVIEMRQGDGTYVTSLEPGLLSEPLDFIFSIDDSTFLQLFEARKVVEVGIVALAAERITDEQIAALEDCLARSEETLHDHQAFLEADLALHELITQAADNPFLQRFMSSISRLGLASRSRTVRIPDVPEETVHAHRAIVAAVTAHDPQAAQAAMLAHLDSVERHLIGLVEDEELAASPYEANAADKS
jgi:GntR family transcriptional repressor for pyruvate dehydrogenase complex